MALTDNIFFTTSNIVETATLTKNKIPATDIEWLKNSKRARQTRWVNPDGIINVNFFTEEPSTVSYFAIPGHDLPDTALIRFLAYDSEGELLHNTGWTSVGELKPAGEFIAGMDEWNTTTSALNNMAFFKIDPIYNVDRVVLSIDHGYIYEEDTSTETTTTTTTVSDGVIRQDETGVVSIEATSCEMTEASGDAWTQVTDTDASGDVAMYKSGDSFYWTAGSGPKLTFNFTAASSGSHKIWLRLKSVDGDSIYTSFDNSNTTSIFRPRADFVNNTWQWKNTATVNLVAGVTHEVVISARDHYLYIDKIVIQPNGSADPSGEGPAESEFGTTTYDTVTGETTTQVYQNFVTLRSVMAGEILQLQENFEHGVTMSFLSNPTNYTTESGYTVTGKAGNKVRTLSLNLAVMNDRDRRVMVQLEETMAGRPFIVSAYPSSSGWIDSKHTFLAKFDRGLVFSHDHWNIHSTNLILTEV